MKTRALVGVLFVGLAVVVISAASALQASAQTVGINGESMDSNPVLAVEERDITPENGAASMRALAAVEPFGVYENWMSGHIRWDRWYGRDDTALEARREVIQTSSSSKKLRMRLRNQGSRTSNIGSVAATNRLYFRNPLAIDAIEAVFVVKKLTVIGCEAAKDPNYTRVRPTMIDLCTFNDGSSTEAGDATGDYFMRIQTSREAYSTDPGGVLTVGAYLYRCSDPACASAYSTFSNDNIGKVGVGQKFTLGVIWDEANSQFRVRLNSNPDVVFAYDPGLDQGPPGFPVQSIKLSLDAGNCEASPTTTDATINVGRIRTNLSAIVP